MVLLQFKLFVIQSMISGLLSLIGSTSLIITILLSKKRLSVPYRRIIFGVSVFDILQSTGFVAAVFPQPKDSFSWSIGNSTTCDIQGFIFNTGATGVQWYLCSLCTYYFCIIRLNVKSHVFRRIEPFLHVIPVLYSVSISSYAVAKQYMNVMGTICTIHASPL